MTDKKESAVVHTGPVEMRAHDEGLPEPSVASMIQGAIDKGIDPDGLTKLVDLYERMDARRAERAFSSALLQFQNACPVIARNQEVDTGKYKYKFAALDYIAATIRPHLDACGLSYSFDTEISDGSITVHTILRHTGGHKERSKFAAPIDKASRMNTTQQVKSARSYAMRCGLELALGIATGGDDDAGGLGGAFIDENQLANLEALIEETASDRGRFLNFLGVDQLANLPERSYVGAVRALEAKRKGGAK